MALTLEDIRQLDADDPLAGFRDRFHLPEQGTEDQVYLCGNSLGLQPQAAADAVLRDLDAWARHGVEAHFQGERPWTRHEEWLQPTLAALAGALPSEVAAMNTLTVNLHLMMVSFYRPQGRRNRIVMESGSFPSDRYAVESQIRWHGLDPAECLVEIGESSAAAIVDEAQVEDYLNREGERVALVLWPGVQYATGQAFDIGRITRAAHAAGAAAGFDLAHAIGNLVLELHDDGPDFAAWCSYKYLNGGPGAIAGIFIHARHHGRTDLPRLNGWWGVELGRRFLMEPEFRPSPGADGWQLSTPPTLSLAPLRASLDLFAEAGMAALREKSLALTTTMERLVTEQASELLEIVTPREPTRRGCQLSFRVRDGRAAGRRLFDRLLAAGVVVDWREPDIIRAAPVPLYNRFEDCWRFAHRVSGR